MFDSSVLARPSPPSVLRAARADVVGLAPAADATEAVEQLRDVTALKGALAAAEAQAMCALRAFTVAGHRVAGVREENLGRGVGEQIGYACRISPASAKRRLAVARTLCEDMPATSARLSLGQVLPETAERVAREVAKLADPGDRRRVDTELAPELHQLSPVQAEGAARARLCAVDPAGVRDRASKAREDRRVWIRPAPDTMAVVSALLPVEQGVAVWAALSARANATKNTGAGDPRTLDQLRADDLVTAITGQGTPASVPYSVQLTISADSLLAPPDDPDQPAEDPAQVATLGPVTGELARRLLTDPERAEAGTWIRRVLTDPFDDTATAVDDRTRRFPASVARLIRARDRTCRDPYCDAAIADLDHAERYADGGVTSAANGHGRCRAGNLAKEAPGWRIDPGSPDRPATITTPTGHVHLLPVPPALGRSTSRAAHARAADAAAERDARRRARRSRGRDGPAP